MQKLKTDHDDYDLAHGPDDLVRRHVIRLPVPESQKMTAQERQEIERALRMEWQEHNEHRMRRRARRTCTRIPCDQSRSEYWQGRQKWIDDYVNQNNPHPRWRPHLINNRTLFAALKTQREELAAMGDLLGFSTPEEG